MKRLISYAFTFIFLVSCTGSKTIQSMMPKNDCSQKNIFQNPLNTTPKPFHEISIDTALSAQLSQESLNSANAIGLVELLEEYVNLKRQITTNNSLENRLQLLELSQKITQRINLASLEISAVASELDCEEEGITQIAEYMKSLEGDKETKLTVAAIIAGASGAIASGIVLSSNKVNSNLEYVGIFSGISEAIIGALILTNKRKVDYFHKRNALQEIWYGKQSEGSTFPPFVWYYLTYENPNEKSIRTQIVERWENFNELGDKPNNIKKYFGLGGKYSTEELYNRANMFDQLESYIKLLKQDLTSLSVEFESMK